jgi:hypothetical protein
MHSTIQSGAQYISPSIYNYEQNHHHHNYHHHPNTLMNASHHFPPPASSHHSKNAKQTHQPQLLQPRIGNKYQNGSSLVHLNQIGKPNANGAKFAKTKLSLTGSVVNLNKFDKTSHVFASNYNLNGKPVTIKLLDRPFLGM